MNLSNKIQLSQLNLKNADVDCFGGLIPFNDKELQAKLNLGKLYIAIHINQDDINKSYISLTAKKVLSGVGVGRDVYDSLMEFDEDERQMILGAVVGMLDMAYC